MLKCSIQTKLHIATNKNMHAGFPSKLSLHFHCTLIKEIAGNEVNVNVIVDCIINVPGSDLTLSRVKLNEARKNGDGNKCVFKFCSSSIKKIFYKLNT